MVDEFVLCQIVRPVAAGLQAKCEACPVEAALEAVKRVFVADRLADHGEVVGIASRHGGEHLLHRVERGFARHQIGNVPLGHDEHGRSPAKSFAPMGMAQKAVAHGRF